MHNSTLRLARQGLLALSLSLLGCGETETIADVGTTDTRATPLDAHTLDAPTADAPGLDATGLDAATVANDAAVNADAGASTDLPWVGGVNLAGAEFAGGTIPGVYGMTYIYPSTAHVDHFIDAGMRVFRIPFRWRRIQPTASGPLDMAELGRLRALTSHITGRGAYVVLDPHDYARREGAFVGSPELPNAVLADLWTRLAREFSADSHVWFGLMNEPNGLPATQWLGAANASIAAIRTAGATNLILVPGVRWTGAHSWLSGGEGSNAAVMSGVVDPADHFAFELHQYLDSDSSGTREEGECVRASVGRDRLVAATDWMRMHGYRAFLGEFAGGNTETCRAAITEMLAYMQTNDDVWFGYTWWAAGPWWGPYMFSLAPRADGSDAPQQAWLTPYL